MSYERLFFLTSHRRVAEGLLKWFGGSKLLALAPVVKGGVKVSHCGGVKGDHLSVM
jgi:hypothetical protein